MKTVDTWPRAVREIMTVWIPMADGCRLAARIWLPVDADQHPVPALLEYLPYRRRDGTSHRDSVTQPYMAGHGYAAVRVDIRGSGDSDGLLGDEYTDAEIDDGVQVIAWLACQNWCNGHVGMWGISWGGINALQVAARQPPALKAIMPMGFADDRYNGDCHFMGGCLLEGNISWGGTLFAGNSRPPDPDVVGSGWRDIWRQRLEAAEPPLAIWLAHQSRDRYWTAASVCEDYGRITAAVYAVSGWQDSYSRNVLPLLQNLPGPKKALIGPWAHGWPHLAGPGPAIGFLQEALRWWDHWLKDVDTGIMDEPMLRVWMGTWVAPARRVLQWPGHWVAEAAWPRAETGTRRWFLAADGLRDEAGAEQALSISSPQTTGRAAGYQCSYGLGPDLSDDQCVDDMQSLCFDSLPLRQPLQLLGDPELDIELISDQPQALLAARLCDVAPDGCSLRLSYGLLNLAQRDGPDAAAPLVPGQRYRIRLRLCTLAHTLAPGHRLRLALSNAYWPIAWPSPVAGGLQVLAASGWLQLPLHPADPQVQQRMADFGPAQGATAQALVELRPRSTDQPQDQFTQDPQTGRLDLRRSRDRGAWKTLDTDVSYDTQGELHFSIRPDDPLSATQSVTLDSTLARAGWQVRTRVSHHLSASADRFFLRATLQAWDGDVPFFNRSWALEFPRDNV